MTKKILVRCDITPQIGWGHAVRCKALLDQIPDKTVTLWGEDPIDFFESSKNASDKLDDFDLMVVDHPKPDEDVFQAPIHKVMIDDFGIPFAMDLAINGSVVKDYHAYPEAKKSLCGPEYALLRPEFAKDYTPTKNYDLCIIVGSGIRARLWLDYLCENFIDKKMALITNQSISAAPCDLYQNIPAEEMCTIIRSSKAVLTTGGMSIYECNALRVPTFAYASEENMLPEIKYFEDKQALVNISDIGKDAKSLAKTIHEKKNQGFIQLIDGRGADRAAHYIIKELLS
jgi:spore coat polysaccharide biosynthesis predicted glycosyltransferase SpsG